MIRHKAHRKTLKIKMSGSSQIMKLKRLYITHCSAKKNTELQGSKKKVTPINLYTASPTQRFMNKCNIAQTNWAILSDKYGVWHSNEKHEWYEKNPNRLTESEFTELLENFDTSLAGYDEIWFYYNPGRFHRIYERLIRSSSISDKIRCFSHLDEIVR